MKYSNTDLGPPLIRLGAVSYVAIPHVKLELHQTSNKVQGPPVFELYPGEYMPVIVMSIDQNSSQKSVLEEIKLFQAEDDVFSKGFLSNIVVMHGPVKDINRLRDTLTSLPTNAITGDWAPNTVLSVGSPSNSTPDGPYFLSQGLHLFEAWRLYPDTQNSFVTGIIPSTHAGSLFQPLDVRLRGHRNAIAVPSRLYSKKTPSKPLAGMRFSVKDNYKVSGIMTTQSNRAWCELYDGKPENITADYVNTLVGLGAVLVGKTLMCSFASSEEATDQWIDFHAPFNPRGDGYQSPSGSTTGGGTSLAAYPWLDFSVGTDTTGSIRWPAAWCGLFGLRTTWREEAMGNVYPACRFMDTVGLLSRDMDGMENLVKTTIPGPKYFSNDQQTAYNPFYYDGYHEFDDFRKEYEEKFQKPVYVGPYMRWKWDRGSEVSREMKEKSLEEVRVYRRWFEENILAPKGSGGTTAVMIIPCGNSVPKYRDDPNSAPGPIGAFTWNYIASVQGLPQLVAPIGNIHYESRISKRTEELPVVGTIIGAAGSDLLLVDVVKNALGRAGRPIKVSTGRVIFSEQNQ
ncbi:Amidase 1 [Daldinia childiae]|uniref:Amidase 1 n=1 Tax=Daldinia childiae TaxID=326645 RepID=UPI001445D582|nr:Amidase 1 [Daldinia childiae]KAF3066593.1 Amidase 1 [Daldinia childiae]